MRDFRKLDVWDRSHRLVLDVFRATGSFPKIEQFGLTSQIRRSAISIPSNIAEGAGRRSERDYGRFLAISLGSTNELDYQLQLASELGYLSSAEYAELVVEVSGVRRMLVSLDRTIRDSA